MIPIYYTHADDMLSFPSTDAVADWIAGIDDGVAIISADLTGHTVQILLGDPRNGATVTEFFGTTIEKQPLLADTAARRRF